MQLKLSASLSILLAAFLSQASVVVAIAFHHPVKAEAGAAPFVSTVSPGKVETIDLSSRGSYSDEFWRQWRDAFPPDHDLYTFDSGKDPMTANEVINAAFCFCLLQGQLHGFLPLELVHKLQTMPYDLNAPVAMVIRGLPVDPKVPPTPTVANTNDFYTTSRPTKCPVAETILLGIARLVGNLHGPKIPSKSHLVRDLMPTSTQDLTNALLMHRDYPRQTAVSSSSEGTSSWEPQFLAMFCVRRGEGDRAASTTLTDYQRLYQLTSLEDRELLRRYRIQTKLPLLDDDKNVSGGATSHDLGAPYHVIEGGDTEEDDLAITLFDYGIPNAYCTCPDAGDDPDLERRVLDAYRRFSDTAMKIGELVSLQPGDLVIINNARCVHGRTAFFPRLDGKDRWYIKCYISNSVWKRPGQGSSSGPSTFPDLGFPQ